MWRFTSSRTEGGRFPRPWERGRPSIHDFLAAHMEAGASGMSDGGEALPDEVVFTEDIGMRWVPGGLDGAFGHHAGGGDAQQVEAVFSALQRALSKPNRRRLRHLYDLLRPDDLLDFIDPLIERIGEAGDELDLDRLYELAKHWATEAPDRGAVKFAIAMLGIFEGEEDLELIRRLGRHEEFTLYAATALANNSPEPEADLWDLARQVEGWGRIHIVERLARTENPEIKAWLLREGYRNVIMDEYLAYTAATTGGLLAALKSSEPDDELMRGAGDILLALTSGGPAEDMDDYDDGAEAVALYLDHMKGRDLRLEDYLRADAFRDFVTEESADWSARAERGWTAERRQTIVASTEEILARPEWRAQAEAGLQSDDDDLFWQARQVAEQVGIDAWEHSFRRQQAGIGEEWDFLMRTDDPARIDRVVALAEQTIPLAEVATGPALEMGLGADFQHNLALDFVVQDLGRFPGKGWPLIAAALRSPVIRNRNMAVNALAAWGAEHWPAEAREMLETALRREPDDDVKGRLARLLEGKAPDLD